jgi:hypothetical protein
VPPKAVTGLANHPANKREWQWLTIRRASPVFTEASASGSGCQLLHVGLGQPFAGFSITGLAANVKSRSLSFAAWRHAKAQQVTAKPIAGFSITWLIARANSCSLRIGLDEMYRVMPCNQ